MTATQTNRAISLLYALTGSYGALGGNVPETAATFADISGQDLLSPEQREKALGLTRRPLGPGVSGWVTARDVYRAVPVLTFAGVLIGCGTAAPSWPLGPADR